MITKNVVITNGGVEVNQLIASHFEQKGYNCFLLFDEKKTFEDYREEHAEQTCILIPNMEESLLQVKIAEFLQGAPIDILIHGNEMLNEEALYDKSPIRLEQTIVKMLNQIYLVNKIAISQMVRLKRGKIIFPLFYDTLYYAGYASSPILNQAKLSLMKCMSKELGAFKLNVNAMTFGYYDNEFEKDEKKAVKSKIEIFSLKPKLLVFGDYVQALDMLIDGPASLIGGENIHVCTGIETGI